MEVPTDEQVDALAKALFERLKMADHGSWDEAKIEMPGAHLLPAKLLAEAREMLESGADIDHALKQAADTATSH